MQLLILYLHSTMYLFQHEYRGQLPYSKLLFTFHYVSISTQRGYDSDFLSYEFTFHYVSISTGFRYSSVIDILNLHSTMYLFQHVFIPLNLLFKIYLHSTMYLFQQVSTLA